MYTHTCTHIYTAALNGLQELLFQLTGLDCFMSRLALTLSLLRVFTHTHTQHIFIVSQTHFVCSLSVRIVRFCRRTNTFKKVYCFWQLCIIYLKTQV